MQCHIYYMPHEARDAHGVCSVCGTPLQIGGVFSSIQQQPPDDEGDEMDVDEDVSGGASADGEGFKHVCAIIALQALDVPIAVSSNGPFRVSQCVSLLNPLGATLKAVRACEIGIDGKYLVHRADDQHFFGASVLEGMAVIHDDGTKRKTSLVELHRIILSKEHSIFRLVLLKTHLSPFPPAVDVEGGAC